MKPIAFLSLLTAVNYLLNLIKIEADKYFAIVFVLIVLWFVFRYIKSWVIKTIWFIFSAIYLVFLIVFSEKLALLLTSYLPKNLYLFSAVNTVLKTFGLFDYENLMFQSSEGGARLIKGDLICGFVNLSEANPQSYSGLFLSAEAIFTFCLCGICISKIHYDREHRSEILIMASLLLLTGNPAPILFMLFITDKPVYYLSVLFAFLSCVAAGLADRAFLFKVSPSVFELLFNSQTKIYLFAVSIFAFSVGYYLSRLAREKLK